jgi:hypothetical protein
MVKAKHWLSNRALDEIAVRLRVRLLLKPNVESGKIDVSLGVFHVMVLEWPDREYIGYQAIQLSCHNSH